MENGHFGVHGPHVQQLVKKVPRKEREVAPILSLNLEVPIALGIRLRPLFVQQTLVQVSCSQIGSGQRKRITIIMIMGQYVWRK